MASNYGQKGGPTIDQIIKPGSLKETVFGGVFRQDLFISGKKVTLVVVSGTEVATAGVSFHTVMHKGKVVSFNITMRTI